MCFLSLYIGRDSVCRLIYCDVKLELLILRPIINCNLLINAEICLDYFHRYVIFRFQSSTPITSSEVSWKQSC